jgi:hypothetical protein
MTNNSKRTGRGDLGALPVPGVARADDGKVNGGFPPPIAAMRRDQPPSSLSQPGKHSSHRCRLFLLVPGDNTDAIRPARVIGLGLRGGL